jgi:hypothetical protein
MLPTIPKPKDASEAADVFSMMVGSRVGASVADTSGSVGRDTGEAGSFTGAGVGGRSTGAGVGGCSHSGWAPPSSE